MNRIEQIFTNLRARDGKALMPFVTAGDPDLATTQAVLPALERAGAHICELGIAFSDPIADGPTIQASMTRALDAGVRPGQVLDMVSRVRDQVSLGLVAMVSYSIVYRLGSFIDDAKAAGIDGFIIPDLGLDEAPPVVERIRSAGLTCSLLIAPTTPIERAQKIAQLCTGFVYVLARAGVTGVRTELPPDLADRIAQLRTVTDLPIAVGFGISSGEHVRQVVRVADAAIVGSALVKQLEQTADKPQAQRVAAVEQFVSELATGL